MRIMNGLWYAMLAGLGFGAYNFLLGRAGTTISASLGTLILTLVAALIAAICLCVQKISGVSITSTKDTLLLVAAAGVCAGIGEIFYFYTFSKNSTVSVVLPIVFTLTVEVGVVLALVFNGEELTLRRGAGLLFALFALVLLAK